MSYLNCPLCGLSVRARTSDIVLERCPRCLAKTGQGIPMYRTPQPRPPLPATAARSGATGRSTPRHRRPTPRASGPARADGPTAPLAAMTAATIRASRARQAGGTFSHLRGARKAGARQSGVRGGDLRDPDVRAAELRDPDVRATELRDPDVRATELRDPDLRAADLRAGDAPVGPDDAPPGAERRSGGELTSP